MKYFKKIFISLIFSCFPIFLITRAEQQLFQLNDTDLSSLNLSESEAQEFKQFIDALNNLPPQDQDFLKKLGQEMEQQMRDKGLDPNNFDDVAKWMETQTPPAPSAQPEKPQIKVPEKVAAPKAKPATPQLVQVTSPTNAKTLLKELLQHLGSLRQKASSYPALAHKLETRLRQELTELVYFLNILSREELLPYLTSKDFAKLYKNLETLHSTIATYEPGIAPQEAGTGDEEDPYELLGIPYTATEDEIKAAYNTLKAEKHPTAIEKQLKAEGISDERARKKRLKEARLTFSFIQDAYDSLKDPQQRAVVDRTLQDKIERANRLEKSSTAAFNKVLDALTTALYPHNILGDIHQLLEKHKPQELAQAKQQLEIEKKVYERSKQPIRVAQAPRAPSYHEGPYDPFYHHMAQESYRTQHPRPYNNSFNKQEPFAQKPMSESTPAKPSKSSKTKPKGKDKAKDEKDKAAKASKKDKAAKQLSDKDAEKAALISSIEELLSGTSNTIEVAQAPTKANNLTDDQQQDSKPEVEKVELKHILANLDTALTSATPAIPTRTPQANGAQQAQNMAQSNQAFLKEITALEQFKQFFEQNKLGELHDKLQKLAPGPQGKLPAALQKMWKEHVYDRYKARIEEWHNQIYPLLNLTERHNKGMKPINKAKLTRWGLDKPEVQLWQKGKDQKDNGNKDQADKDIPVDDTAVSGDLGLYRNYIKGIHEYFKNINQAFGVELQAKAQAPQALAQAPHAKRR